MNIMEDSIQDKFQTLSTTVEKIRTNMSKIIDVEVQMNNLSVQGFDVSASLDTLKTQKSKYEEFILSILERIDSLQEDANTVAAEISN